ncbi:hypothetical protein BSKO_06151 [Bryopsis sp. KO-2023]|nr:hypothetical protein BSKO_06151 [Bryopsis sp. KO-2023]
MATKDDKQNLFKILLATDNHLGVWEKDQVRKDDSFNTFAEILQLAKDLGVDFVLLGGDLFHENKPSRSSLVRGVDIFAKHCLGNQPVKFQVLSDPWVNFEKSAANYENPNLNIGLPVFTIHGNHDDPSGEGNLSAVDVLSSCGLVNYFGKSLLDGAGQGKVRLNPVLLEKGTTKIALYGLGHIRDERLGRLFQTPGCVEWVRPKVEPAYPSEDWFNIFVLHQNRVQHGAQAKNCVQEKYLARFIDFVLWGHEHECLPDPQASAVGKFNILQPGSSVATALSEGESRNKHVVLLEVMGDKWRTIKYPLQTVRPFKFQHVVLSEQNSVDPDDPDSITSFLEQRVEEMIKAACREKPTPAGTAGVGGGGKKSLLPIVRLRVDYTGFSTINSQRFGQKFVNKVANPHDIIMWSKAAKRKEAEAAGKGTFQLGTDQLDQTTIDDLISANLRQDLEILAEEDLTMAVHQFVEKDEKNALSACYASTLTETQKSALKTPTNPGSPEVDVGEAAAKQMQKRKMDKEMKSALQLANAGDDDDEVDDDMDIDSNVDNLAPLTSEPEPRSTATRPATRKRQQNATPTTAPEKPKRLGGTRGRPGTLDAFLVPKPAATQETATGTQRTAVFNAEDADELESNPPSASRRRSRRENQGTVTGSKKRGTVQRTFLDSEDEDEQPRVKKTAITRRRRGLP